MQIRKFTPILLGMALVSFSLPGPKTMPLEQAVAEGKVAVEWVALGGHSGACTKLTVTNLNTKKINIQLDAGTLLYPDDEGDQTLITTQERILALDKSGKRSMKLDGFCTEASDRSPGSGSHFAVKPLEDEKLLQLMAYLEGKRALLANDDLIQQAVWAVTDQEDISSIYDPGNKDAAALRKFVCDLTGQEDVWYNTQVLIREDGDRRIVRDPQIVSGELAIRTEAQLTMTAVVMNESGEVIYNKPGTTNLPKGNVNFGFSIQVDGWSPGTYAVVYSAGSKTMLRKAFTI